MTSTTNKLFQGNNDIPISATTTVTDILVRGGGGTITFSDGITVEYFFGFIPDSTVSGGGRFGITLEGSRAARVYQSILQQNLCETIDWLLECSQLNNRVTTLETQVLPFICKTLSENLIIESDKVGLARDLTILNGACLMIEDDGELFVL